MNDQLKEDMRRDEQVALGKITQFEADDEAVVWAEVSAKGQSTIDGVLYAICARMDASKDHR